MRRAALLSAVLLLALARGAGAEDPAPGTPSPPAARVVAAIAAAASENVARRPGSRLAGDALADHYVRRAAAAAEGNAQALLVALAHAFDADGTLAKFPLTRAAFSGIETPEGAAARRKEMGDPALRGRADLLLHFVVPAALFALTGEGPARLASHAKELADMNGGSGFSFVDLYADEAGIAFAKWLAEKDPKARLARVAASFVGAEHLPEPERFPEGITKEAFERDYESVKDPRYAAVLGRIRDAVDAARRPLVEGPWWTPVGALGEFPISGLAFAGTGEGGATEYLAVRDHPHPGGLWHLTVQTSGAVAAKPVEWACGKVCPRDAEAICAVPGCPRHFVVLSSEGTWLHVALAADGKAETVARSAFEESPVVPPRAKGARNYEGLTLQALGEGKGHVAVWGDRGRGDDWGLVVWARASVAAGGPHGCRVAIGPPVGSKPVSPPEPRPVDDARRHVSELKLAPSGTLWGVTARDPRDAGPFDAALYLLGTISARDGTIVFDRAPALTPHRSFPGHKVEAMEIGPDGSFLFGADDERTGGWVLRAP